MANPRGSEHQKIKARLLPLAYGTPCPRCKKPMLKGQELELGHTLPDGVVLADVPDTPGDRIEHMECNREAGLRAGQLHARFKPSRDWWGNGRQEDSE